LLSGRQPALQPLHYSRRLLSAAILFQHIAFFAALYSQPLYAEFIFTFDIFIADY